MSEKSGKADRYVWTHAEDELLIRFMLESYEKGELNCDSGLKPGVLDKLKEKLHAAIPGCRIQAHPHIQSRYKNLKKHFGVVTELLKLSGFGWNSETKCVTAPKTVWDDYIKGNKKAAKFRHNPFPFYEEFSIMFGKDCAQGTNAEQYDDAVEEINNEHDLDELDVPPEQTPPKQTPEEHTPSAATAGSKKRKRNSTNRDEFILQGMERIANTLVEGLKEASEQLAIHMNRDEREKCLDEREKHLDDMKDSLYDDIMQVEELSDQQRDSAYIKLMSDEKLLIAFYAAPQEGKARLLHRMIA